jgi:hypothetical protein
MLGSYKVEINLPAAERIDGAGSLEGKTLLGAQGSTSPGLPLFTAAGFPALYRTDLQDELSRRRDTAGKRMWVVGGARPRTKPVFPCP